MLTRRVLATVCVMALGGYLVALEPDDAVGPSHSAAIISVVQR